MAVLVTYSKQPVLLDTVPVVKTVNYNGVMPRDNVYCYGRMYLTVTGLCIGFSVFDRTPPQSQRVGAAFNFAPDKCGDYIFADTDTAGVTDISVHFSNGGVKSLSRINAQISAGQDEQGYYWACEYTLPNELITEIYADAPTENKLFCGNLFLHYTDSLAFASAFKVPAGVLPPTDKGFGDFIPVGY